MSWCPHLHVTVPGSSPRGRDRAEQEPLTGPTVSPAGPEQSPRRPQAAWSGLEFAISVGQAHGARSAHTGIKGSQGPAKELMFSNHPARSHKQPHREATYTPQKASQASDERDTRARCLGDSPRARPSPGGAGHSPVDEVANDRALLGRVGGLPAHDDVVPVRIVAMHVHGRSWGPGDQGVSI